MTLQRAITSERETFIELLDSQLPVRTDAIVVLRNWDKEETRQRVEKGIELLTAGFAKVMILTYDVNTRAESSRVVDMVQDLHWKSLILVTHKSHHYRAYLTFIQTFKDFVIELYSCPLGHEVYKSDSALEFAKIESYSALGDCASYKEGIAYLQWLMTGQTSPY